MPIPFLCCKCHLELPPLSLVKETIPEPLILLFSWFLFKLSASQSYIPSASLQSAGEQNWAGYSVLIVKEKL